MNLLIHSTSGTTQKCYVTLSARTLVKKRDQVFGILRTSAALGTPSPTTIIFIRPYPSKCTILLQLLPSPPGACTQTQTETAQTLSFPLHMSSPARLSAYHSSSRILAFPCHPVSFSASLLRDYYSDMKVTCNILMPPLLTTMHIEINHSKGLGWVVNL